ncbi:MAG: hypothetical protein WAQ10_08120 [Dethiobacteria bacterium]
MAQVDCIRNMFFEKVMTYASHLRCGQKIIRAKEKRPLFSYSLASKSNNFTGRYLFNSKYIHLRPFKRHLRLGVWHVS